MAAVWFGWICLGFGLHCSVAVMRALAILSQQGCCFREPGQPGGLGKTVSTELSVAEPLSNLTCVDLLNLNSLRRRGRAPPSFYK